MSEIAVFPGASSEGEVPSSQPVGPFDEVAAYYAYLQRNRDAEAAVRERWVKKPGYSVSRMSPTPQPWEQTGFDDQQRQQVWVGSQIIEMNKKKQIFSQAAALIATSHERAQFYDDVMCDYVGDPERLGQFREISPRNNHTPFTDVDFHYSKGVVNAFAGDKIIHVRETLDPDARSRSQKLFIVVANLMTMEVQRLYADDKPHIESLGTPELHFNEIIPLTSGTLQDMAAHLGVGGSDPLQPYLEEFAKNQQTAMQPHLIKSANDGWLFKPEGYAERSKLLPIKHLAQERGVLWALAQARGLSVSNRGALIQPVLQSEIEQ
jgi:hypothetical protein